MGLNVRTYVKPHTSENGGTVIYSGGRSNSYAGQNINVKSVTAVQGDIDDLKARYIEAQQATLSSINSDNGNIHTLVGEALEYTEGVINDLTSQNIKTVNLTVDDSITANNLTSQNIVSNSITTDTLYVNKSAHFFELVIDKIRSVNGTFINTAANCKIDYVEGYDLDDNIVDMDDPNFDPDDVDYFKVYWKNTDDDGNEVDNKWLENDYAISQSFNTQANKYYWRLVVGTDNGSPEYINFETKQRLQNDPGAFSLTFSTPIRYGGINSSTHLYEYNELKVDDNIHYSNNVWSPLNINEILTILPLVETSPGSGEYEKILCTEGELNFSTNKPSKLNITVYYDDGTIEYKQIVDINTGEQVYANDYHIVTSAEKEIDKFEITTSVIDKWDACNWIAISNDATNHLYDPASNGLPEKGDEIVQLGYKYDAPTATQGVTRASAIIIAAYNTVDSGITAPCYAQYQKINPAPTNWNLGDYRMTYFDANGGCVMGDFIVEDKAMMNKTEILSSTGEIKMWGPDKVDSITGDPISGANQVELFKIGFTKTDRARASYINIKSPTGSIYTNIWQESIAMSNDDNYITMRPETITYGLRPGYTYDYRRNINAQSMSVSWPSILNGSQTNVKIIDSGSSYTASLQEGVIILKDGISSPFNLYLPQPQHNGENEGKFYFIKNKSSVTGSNCIISLYGGGSLIMDNNGDYVSSKNLDRNSLIVCCDGECWIMFGGYFD